MRLAEKIISIRMRYLKKISYLCTCIFRQRFQDNMVRQCFILFGCLALGEKRPEKAACADRKSEIVRAGAFGAYVDVGAGIIREA